MLGLTIKKKEQIRLLEADLHNSKEQLKLFAAEIQELKFQLDETKRESKRYHAGWADSKEESKIEIAKLKEKLEVFKRMMLEYEQAVGKFTAAATQFETDVSRIDTLFMHDEDEGDEHPQLPPPDQDRRTPVDGSRGYRDATPDDFAMPEPTEEDYKHAISNSRA